MIGSTFLRHSFNQSEVKPKPIVARAFTFSRALCRLRVITSSFDWFTGLSPSFFIGQSNYFGFGFTTLVWKPLYEIILVLRRGENRSTRRKTPRSRVENQQTQPTYDAGSGNQTLSIFEMRVVFIKMTRICNHFVFQVFFLQMIDR